MNKMNISNTETMKCKIKYLFLILLAFTQTSCKSDKEKADDFINTLSKETEVLLALPNSSPSCIFFTDGRIIKSHNINNDSTKTIPYGNIIDEDAVEEILAGDSNIIVITKDEENTKNAYIYDVGQQKFSEIKPFKANQKVTETKLSKSNKTISFIYDQSISNVAILDWSEYYEHENDYEYLKNTAYNIIIKYYNFDGRLIKTKKKPVTIKEYVKKIQEEENVGSTNNYNQSYRPVYLWKCSLCKQEAEGIEEPNPRGCPLWGGTVHRWYQVSQIR